MQTQTQIQNRNTPPQQGNFVASSNDTPTIDDLHDLATKGFVPLLSKEELIEFENKFRRMGQNRRLCLSLLTKSSKELIKSVSENYDVFENSIELLKDFEDSLKVQQEAVDFAFARLVAVAGYVCKESENA